MSTPLPTAQDASAEAFKGASSGLLQILEAAKNNKSFPQYLAIEGPIGVGKTTLAHKIAETFNYDVFLEQPAENPFLKNFYSKINIPLKYSASQRYMRIFHGIFFSIHGFFI